MFSVGKIVSYGAHFWSNSTGWAVRRSLALVWKAGVGEYPFSGCCRNAVAGGGKCDRCGAVGNVRENAVNFRLSRCFK